MLVALVGCNPRSDNRLFCYPLNNCPFRSITPIPCVPRSEIVYPLRINHPYLLYDDSLLPSLMYLFCIPVEHPPVEVGFSLSEDDHLDVGAGR